MRAGHGLGDALSPAAHRSVTEATYGPVIGAVETQLDAGRSDGTIRADADPPEFLQLTGALWRAASGPEDRSQPMLGLILDGCSTCGEGASMEPAELRRAVAAASSIASSLGIPADDAVVLSNSNKVGLRLLPGDVMARVAPATEQIAQFEIDIARQLAGSPVAMLDPRVEPRAYERDAFVVTLWTYYEPVGEVAPASYAEALGRVHAGMRTVDLPTPHFTDRVAEARQLLADPERTPALAGAGRELLTDTLVRLGERIAGSGRPEQLLHGEPHPGNLLSTQDGPRFIDLETCCRGPVEFDLAHAPAEVDAFYPGADLDLVRDCRTLVLAMITTWRWDRDDQFPDGLRLGTEWLARLSATAGPAAE